MTLNSADRFETVEEFWQLLNAHAPEQQVQLPRVTSVDAPQPLPERDIERTIFARKHWILLLIFLALLVAVAFGTGLLSHVWGLSVILLLCLGALLLVFLSLIHQQ